MEYVQERITTLHAFEDPQPPLPARTTVVVPMMAGAWSETVTGTFEQLETVGPDRIVVPLRGKSEDVREIVRWLQTLDVPVEPIWCNAPAIERLLTDHGLDQPAGKGLDVWLALGLAASRAEHVVVHDADSGSYSATHVPRLAWPLTRGIGFVKGYYARVENSRLYGRLTRLLCLPLIETARRLSAHQLLEYLGAFRYPLAGEYAMTSELATQLRLPSDWGLELGMLVDCYGLTGFAHTAQADLGWHRHDHRPVSGGGGLVQMAGAVIDALAYGLTDAGIPVDWGELRDRYRTVARNYIDRYEMDAAFNGLSYDRQDELAQVQQYAELIEDPGDDVRLPPFENAGISPDAISAAGTTEPLR